MNISVEAAMLLPLFLGVGAFCGDLGYEMAIAARHARWTRRMRG